MNANRKFTEGRIQQSIVMWFRNEYCLAHHNPRFMIFSVPNDGYNVKEQQVKKATGLLSGVSDLIVLLPTLTLFIEVKVDSGIQSDSQIEFEEIVNNLGYKYKIVRSIDEFKEFINPIIENVK